MKYKYTIDDLLLDVQLHTVIDRQPFASYVFALGHGALLKESATLRFTTRQLLDHLALAGAFGPEDTIELDGNALSDEEVAGFLRTFLPSKRRLPSIDLTGNPLGKKTVDVIKAIVSMERSFMPPFPQLPLRFILLYDTLIDLDSMEELKSYHGGSVVPQVLPIPDRVMLLAAEQALQDVQRPTSRSCSPDRVGQWIWAGFLTPTILTDNRDVVIRLYKKDAQAQDYIQDVSRIVFTLAIRSLPMDSITFSHVDSREELRLIRDALLPTSVSYVEFRQFTPPQEEEVQTTMQSFLEDIRSLQCILWVDPSSEEDQGCFRSSAKQWMRRQKESFVLREEHLRHPPLVEAAHCRMWLTNPAIPLSLHQIPQKMLALPSLMAMMSMQSNVQRLSFAYAKVTLAQLQTLLESLPPPPCCCVKEIDLRQTNLFASELWNTIRRYPHLHFEYEAQRVPLVRGLRLTHNAAKKIEVVKENNLSFQAAVLSLKERQQSQRQQSGSDTFLQFHRDMTDAQLAASLASYVEQVGHLPAMVDLTNLDAEKEVLSFLAQYVYTLVETEMEVPRTAFFLSNTRLPIAGIRALPSHRTLSFFPKMIPSSALSFRDIVLNEQTIVPFIEGGGTDAAAFHWVACNKLLSASPGMFSTSIMYSIFFRILATRSDPPLRAIALVDRSCSTMRLSEVARLMVQHLKSVEYVLVAELRKWEVDMRISHHASEEANDVNVNRMVMASVQLLAGSLPLLRQIDVFPYKGKYRPATFQFVAHVQEAVLQSYGLHVSYLHRLPNYVGFCGGAVHGRIRPGADNLLLYSDQVSLPFSPEEVIELMSRRGHGQQALSFAMKGADVNDNTLMSLYLSAVEPLEMVDFSGTAVTMTGIKLIADHPEVESTIRTLHFANIPHLMRLNHMKDRPTLFHGISSTIQTPTSVMLERMRLAQSVVLNIGAKPRMEREAVEGEDLQDIESGDDLLRFLRRVSLVLRKTEFSHFLEGTSMKIGEDRFDWSHVPDTLHFTMDTIAVWKELSPVLFLSFFRFASLDRLVHRMIFEQGLAISDNLLLLFFTLPGSIEFVIEDPSSLTTSFLDAQWLAHFTTNHIVILYGQVVEKYRPNDRLAILQQGQDQEIRIVSSEGETALIRHLPYLMASRGNRAWISGMPMNVLLFMLMPESSLCFPHLHYLLLDNMKWNGSIERLGAEQILHVFPSLNNVVLTLEERRPDFDLHIATIFNRYRIRGQHPTFHWTNTEKGVLFTDVQQLMGETAILPRRFHLWLPKGRLHVPFPMDLLHYDRWVAVVKALKANFSNIVRIDLSSVMIAFDFFVNQPEVFEHIEEWDLSGTVLASDIAESVWSSMERVVHWRNKKNASTMVMLEEDQWDALQRSHPSLFTLLTRTSAKKEVVVEDAVDATGEEGLLPSDVDPQINETALETYHVLRDTLILSEDAKQAVATWSERSLVSATSWKEVDVREWSVDAVLHALGHAVLDGLAAQQMKQKWTHATFSHPRLLYVTHGTPSSTIHLSSTGLLILLQLAGEGQYIRYAKGVAIEMRVGEWVVVPRAAIHPLGSTPMLLLALQLDLFVREEAWEVVPSLQHNDLYNQMHRIEEQPLVPIQPPLPAFTPIPSDALPMNLVPAEEVPTSMAWRNDVEAALTSLYSFLMESGHGTPFASMWYMKESNEKVLWIGFYANQSVHVRFIAFEHVKPVERKISTFKSNIKKQMEHSIAFTTPIHSPNNVVFTIHNPVLQMNKFSLMLPKSNIRSVGMETFESKWELDYPYATSSTPVLPSEVTVVPPPPSPEVIVVPPSPPSPISFASPLSFLEDHGYVYEDYLGKGATAYVVRVRQIDSGKRMAAKIFLYLDEMKREVQNYNNIYQPELKDILIHLEDSLSFSGHGLSMVKVVGVVGAQRILEASSTLFYGGVLLYTLMDGSLFSEGVVPSWHMARFILLLQSTPLWMDELWIWMQQAETAMVAAHVRHGDPGLRNILFHWDEETGERFYRLGDFGLSKENALEEDIQHEWGLFRNFVEKMKRRFIPVDRYRHESHHFVTVTYDASRHQLWIVEADAPEPNGTPHVFLYDHVILNPPPSWKETWMETFGMTVIPAEQKIKFQTPEPYVFEGVTDMRLYVVSYGVPYVPEESSDDEEESSSQTEEVVMKSGGTEWIDFLLNKEETRTPLMKVLTGEPEIRIGFMDEQEMFEYVTIHFPNFKAEKAKTAARSLQDNVRDFFAKESGIQVENVSVDQDVFLASFTYDGGKSKVFRVESVGIVVEEQRKQVQEEKKKSKRKNLSALGYAFEKTLDVGQESIVVLANKEGKRYAIKLFRESPNFEEYRRPSFLNDQIILNNFFETERDAYLAIQQLEPFARLKPLVLGYVEGQALSPSIKASTFVGQPTGEKEVLIVGYLVLDYMDNDLNLERKKRRNDWDVLFDLRTRGMVAFESFLNQVQTTMESLSLSHLDLHLYNVFYQRRENGLFDFRLGDLATMRYNQHSVLEEEEWARLRKEVEGAMEPTKMIAQETIQQKGRIAYAAEQQILHVDYATATFETRLYVYPLTLKETPSFLSKEGEEVMFGAVLKEEGGRIAQSFELTFVKEDGEKTTIRMNEKQMAQAGIYKFEQPTEQTVKKAKEAEVIPSTKMAVYKPAGGKYDTSRWSAVMAPFNELIQDKEHEWTVTMERDAEDPTVLKMIVNELTVITLKGLLSSRIDKLLAKPYLSIESIEVIHVHRSYLVRVEMRVKKQDKKWRIRFRLKVPDMSLFDVTLNETSLTYLKEHPVDKKMEGANVILLTDDDPMVFSHALDSSVTIGQKHDLYEKELRNRQGKTVYQVFSVNGRGFLLEDVRLAVLSPSGQSRFTTDIAEANLFILLTTEVDRSYVELRRVAFGVFQFSHDADMKNKLIVVNEKSVKITRYDFMYRFFSKGMIVEFESIPENAQGYGAFNYYEDVPDSVVQTVYFLPWFNDGALLSFVSIPAPPTEDPMLLNRFYELLEEHRHATSGIVKEETEEEEDEYAEALREGLEEEEEHSSLSSQSEEGLVVVEGQEEATKEVSEFLEFAKLKATKTNRLQVVNPLLRTSLSFSSSAMSYSKTTKTMTFHKWVNEQEEVFRFVLNNVDDKDTFSSAVADAFEQTSLLDAMTNARYNHGSIGWKIVSKYNNVKGWKAVVTIEDTWSGIRAFVHALLPKIIASEDRNPAHLWTFGLLEARHALERTFMECEGEECTAILLRRMKMAFPDLALGNTVEEQMNVLKVAGVIEEGNAAGLFLSLAWKDRIEQAILSQDAAMMDAAVLLLIVIHEKVSADASMTRAFFESFQQLFPTQWTLTELQSLNKMYDVQYGGIILPLSRDDLPKKTFVSKRSLQTLTQQVNKEGLEVVTLTFHPTS